jgi:hypothetical protein
VTALELDGDLATPDNFPLPTVGQNVLSRMRNDIYQGKGFAVLRGLDSSKYSVEDMTTIYLGVQAHIANRFGRQDKKGNMLGKKESGSSPNHTGGLTTFFSSHHCRRLFQAKG